MEHSINNLTVAHLFKVLGVLCLEPRISVRKRHWFMSWASWMQSTQKTHTHIYTQTHTHIHTHTHTLFFIKDSFQCCHSVYLTSCFSLLSPWSTVLRCSSKCLSWNPKWPLKSFFTQRIVVISYRRFGTTYRPHLQYS